MRHTRDQTLKALFERSLRRHARQTAVVLPGETLTYGDLDRRSLEVAAGLWSLGIRPGDPVALLISNQVEYPICDMAIMRLGAAKVPLNEMLAPTQISYMINHSNAKVLLVGRDLRHLADGAQAAFEADVIVLHDLPSAPSCEDEVLRLEVDPAAPAAIYYTGGTTGKPKGVVHSQRSLSINIIAEALEGEVQPDERMLLTTPLPHAAGLFLQAGLLRGASCFIRDRFQPEDTLTAIERDEITWTFAVPTMIYRLLDALARKERTTTSLRTIVYGAAPITPTRLSEALAAFGPVFVQLYGQTECPNWGTRLSKADHAAHETRPNILGSCGQAATMADVKVVDRSGATVAAGESGEICLRAPYNMDRYHANAEATSKKFLDGGWIRTGDLGLMDREGYVYLKDRDADMIISGGMNVYSTEVETAVQACPGVAQVAVIGVPDSDWGEAVHAVVVVDRESKLTADAVMQHCNDRLAKYQRPKSISFADELPVTAYGKVDKKALRAPHWADHERAIN